MILIELLWCASTVTAVCSTGMMVYLYRSYDKSLGSLIRILDRLLKERIELASHQESS
jgi:hypothetical protein